jgi:hypothetical protein
MTTISTMPLTTTARCLARPPHRGRRGALLLLVLSMLTLFMMIGTLMLVLAMRARSTARAFADAVAGPGNRAATARGLLDEALMTLVRGTVPAAGVAPTRESLLADRYGSTTQSGTLTALAASGPILRATVTGINATKPLELVGRILTIKPQATDPAPVTSFRILSASGTTLDLANLRTVGVRQRPTTFPCQVFVNGREFAGATDNESADAFDAKNLFLTQASAAGGTVTVARPAYQAAGGGNPDVDNDGDGVADGIWLDDLLPDQPDDSKVRVSFLVLDLGGRLNVNAHGTPAAAPGSGPAAVDGGPLFSDQAIWSRILGGGASPAAPQAPANGNRRAAPALGSGLQGRFGGGPADTYALRLDFDGPRTASRTATAGNVFTCGELEWVLRPFDDDTTTLPPRLAALLGESTEAARLLVTTDSWDTCGIVGKVARDVAANGDPATLPEDAKEGIRFNLDRELADQAAKQEFFEDLLAVVVAAGAPAAKAAQWCANVVEFIDNDVPETPPQPFTLPAGIPGGAVTGVEPGTLPQAIRDVLPVKNPGSFESPAVLLAIPAGTKTDIEEAINPPVPPPKPVVSLAVDHPEILDAVTVASPFRSTVFVESGGRTLCRWREPGRINVNTCDDKVWDALTGQSIANPFKASPAQSLADLLLKVPQVITGPDRDVRGLNLGLANRLANIATTRSDVFAVWITLEWTPAGANAVPTYHRLFAIVDRSIPVGHAAGQDLNARDTIRVLRHLE